MGASSSELLKKQNAARRIEQFAPFRSRHRVEGCLWLFVPVRQGQQTVEVFQFVFGRIVFLPSY
jgi:hypothetical protein